MVACGVFFAQSERPITSQGADQLEEVNRDASEPMPLANVIDAPSDMVGVTVISEESSSEGE